MMCFVTETSNLPQFHESTFFYTLGREGRGGEMFSDNFYSASQNVTVMKHVFILLEGYC